MPFAGYTSFEDCVSKNQDKDNPEAYCGSIKAKTEMRHRDFQRIHDEFCNYYKNVPKGETEYYSWLQALHLDEEREYGQARESFTWVKDMLHSLREDTNNKYYSLLIGFPMRSMNNNIYKERDLIAAALSLKGKHPSLNHKNDYWFNEHSHYGTLTVEDAKYEDGAVEAILQVPKTAVCPICNGAKMTELIDNQRIVNVSLEGGCKSDTGGCDGFEFSDPPFTLLTTDVLPGIPLARIKPLEHIMVEALQNSSTLNQTKKVKRLKIEAKIKESTPDPATKGLVKPPQDTVDTITIPNLKSVAQSGYTPAFRGNLQSVSQQTNVAIGTDPASSKPEGIWQTEINDPMKPWPHESVKRWKEAEDPMAACMKDMMANGKDEDTARDMCTNMMTHKEGKTGTPGTMDQPTIIQPNAEMPHVDSHVGPDRSSAPDTHLSMPEGDTSMNPTEPSKWRPEVQAPYKSGTFPSLEERVARIKAESKAKSFEEQALVWEQKHNEVYEKLKVLEGQYQGLNSAFDKLNERSLTAERDRTEAIGKYNAQCGLVTDLKATLDRTTKDLNTTSEKYNTILKHSLELNQKLTQATEDYLASEKKAETAEDKFQEARKYAKRTVRLKV